METSQPQVPSTAHPWHVYDTARQSLIDVFKPSEGHLHQLVHDSPFFDLVVEHCLAEARQAPPSGERYITAKKRAIAQIRSTPLYHQHLSSLAALNAYLDCVSTHLRRHQARSTAAVA